MFSAYCSELSPQSSADLDPLSEETAVRAAQAINSSIVCGRTWLKSQHRQACKHSEGSRIQQMQARDGWLVGSWLSFDMLEFK